jgi:hypothetical protein
MVSRGVSGDGRRGGPGVCESRDPALGDSDRPGPRVCPSRASESRGRGRAYPSRGDTGAVLSRSVQGGWGGWTTGEGAVRRGTKDGLRGVRGFEQGRPRSPVRPQTQGCCLGQQPATAGCPGRAAARQAGHGRPRRLVVSVRPGPRYARSGAWGVYGPCEGGAARRARLCPRPPWGGLECRSVSAAGACSACLGPRRPESSTGRVSRPSPA